MRGSGGEPSLLDKFVKVRLLYIVNLALRDVSALLQGRRHDDRREGRNVERESRRVPFRAGFNRGLSWERSMSLPEHEVIIAGAGPLPWLAVG